MLNGLTYESRDWQPLVEALALQGRSTLRFDFHGQGETRRRYGAPTEMVKIDEQVDDLRSVLEHFSLRRFNVLGFSYGGGVALKFASELASESASEFNQAVDQLILLAPYTSPIAVHDNWIRKQMPETATAHLDEVGRDALYDSYLKRLVYATFPVGEREEFRELATLESMFRLSQGIRRFHANQVVAKFTQESAPPIHLIIAAEDEIIPRAQLEEFWQNLPRAAQAGFHVIADSRHKVPELQTQRLAELIMKIIKEKNQ